MKVLVFDIGGSQLRAALWDSDSQSLRHRCACPSPGLDAGSRAEPVTTLLQAMQSLAERVRSHGEAQDAIGIAFPGPVDADGMVAQAPTLWGSALAQPLDLARAFGERVAGCPVHVANDLTAAGYRYREPESDFCIVTVSSGVGNKVFLGGRPALGPNHRGGEMGHWRVDLASDAAPCDCGGRGHLGALASGRAVGGHARSVAENEPDLLRASSLREHDFLPDSQAHEAGVSDLHRAIASAYQRGDGFAGAVVAKGARPMGQALALLHLGLGLERFIIMGGWAQALGRRYLEDLAAAASACSWDNGGRWTEWIEAAASDDDSGLIGMGRMMSLRAEG